MRRTISILMAVLIILGCTLPVLSVAETNRQKLYGSVENEAGSRNGNKTDVANNGQISLVTPPNGAKSKQAADLNEALNVPGGDLQFEIMDYPDYGFYPWIVDGDCAKSESGPVGIYGVAQATVSTYVDAKEGKGVTFRFRVSCQAEEGTDWFAFFVDNSPVCVWYGEVDWTDYSYPLPAGEHELAWCYNKDDSIDEGEDAAWLDDVEIVEASLYESEHSIELDNVLNVEGGELEFYTVVEASNGYYPWIACEDYAKSTNEGVNASPYSIPPSISTMTTTVVAQQGDVLTFRYRVSSEEKMDLLRFYVDGERIERWSGEIDWSVYIYELEAGEHEFKWEYDKDWSQHIGEDAAYIDDVSVASAQAVTGIEIQPTASVPACRRLTLEWKVLPDTAFNRNVSFSSSDESIVTVDENGVITGISEGEAQVCVTTEDGGYTAYCTVTVTEAVPPVDIYGFMYARKEDDTEGYYRDMYEWCKFNDVYPEDVTMFGLMPGYEYDLVLCAIQVGDTVYGYDYNGRFFKLDFELLQIGEVYVEYLNCNVTGDESFYPTEMAYDYSTGKAYVINMMTTLWEVDLETGDLDLDSGKTIDGIIPNPGQDTSALAVGFAIDLDGNAYIMLAGMGLAMGGNGCARFASFDLETAEFTVIAQTDVEAYQEQSMCFDYNTGKLYWSQFNTVYGNEPMQLYLVDTETAQLECLGNITQYGAEILGMFIPYDNTEVPPEITPAPVTPTPEPTQTPVVPPETEEPTQTPVIPPETEEPTATEMPTIPTESPAPSVPPTGTLSLMGIGIVSLIAGAAITARRKK